MEPAPFRALRDAMLDRVQSVLRRHGRKMWWVHSFYALTLGVFVVFFAQKGFEQARWLAVSIISAWLLVIVFFRLFGAEEAKRLRQAEARAAGVPILSQILPSRTGGAKIRFFVMTYVLKNLYQGMLFFLLPFYWKSSTRFAPNFAFVMLLGLCAALSTVDLVFDRFVLKRRLFASAFHGLTLFASLNLVIPALFPDTRTLYTLMSAAGVAVLAFWTLHASLAAIRELRNAVIVLVSVAAGVTVAYYGRTLVPPVPMYLSAAAVGPAPLEDGRLAMEVKTLHFSVIHQLRAVTDVVVPGGRGDTLQHVWRHEGREVHRAAHDVEAQGRACNTGHCPPRGTIRLQSTLTGKNLPTQLVGEWTVEVQTEDGQVVGRTAFTVVE